MADEPDQARPGMSSALGGTLAAVGIVLSNLATVLKSLKEVREAADLNWLTVPVVSRTWWAILILLVGNAILFWCIYRYIPKEHPTTRIVGAGAAVVVAVFIFAFNLFALPRQLPDITDTVHKQLVSQLLATQARDGDQYRGFNDALSNASQEDTWSTAQSLVAIMTSVSDIESMRPRLLNAFNFIESRKDPTDSCGLWVQQVGKSKLTRTDIAGWVALAYLKSLASDQVWQATEVAPAVNRTINILDCIKARQDQTGAWGPTVTRSVTNDRTYPTLMAIWALSEAKRTKLVKDQILSRYDGVINGGVQWLLRNYHNPAGWYPDPADLHDSCDGLNSQALFVLSRAEHLSGIDDLSRNETYKSIKQNFLKDSPPQKPAGKPYRPADKRFEVDGEVLFVSFLDYPWALADAKFLAQDESLGSGDRKKASEIYASLVSESESLSNGFPIDAYTFQLSETITCMFYK